MAPFMPFHDIFEMEDDWGFWVKTMHMKSVYPRNDNRLLFGGKTIQYCTTFMDISFDYTPFVAVVFFIKMCWCM